MNGPVYEKPKLLRSEVMPQCVQTAGRLDRMTLRRNASIFNHNLTVSHALIPALFHVFAASFKPPPSCCPHLKRAVLFSRNDAVMSQDLTLSVGQPDILKMSCPLCHQTQAAKERGFNITVTLFSHSLTEGHSTLIFCIILGFVFLLGVKLMSRPRQNCVSSSSPLSSSASLQMLSSLSLT